MPRLGRRERIGHGLYRDKSGVAAIVHVGTQQREKRFPLGTDPKLMQRWRDRAKVALQDRQPLAPRGTLAADSKRYLALVTHLASHKARKAELAAWCRQLPDRHRNTITSADVLLARGAWLAAGTNPKTINNRVQTLRHLYATLDGKKAETPCDEVTPLPTTKTPPVFISPELVVRVEANLAVFEQTKRLLNRKTRARFRVYATCGKRPCEIMRAQPADVDLARRVWTPRDAKGGYSPGLYLNDDMRGAWEFFMEAEAWGWFDTNSFARVLRGAGWPAGVKPYNLRHTTWITASERGADLADIQAGAGHKHLATTRRHYVPVLDSRMQRLSELLEGRFTWGAVPSAGATGPPDTTGES